MPYISVQTNVHLEPADKVELMKKISSELSLLLKKPEDYVMVGLIAGAELIFAGTDEPAAYVELKSIRLPESETEHLSEQVCQMLASELGVPAGRIYIEFIDIPGRFWGWNNSTF